MSDPSLRGRYSPVVAHTDSFANPIWLFLPSALASYKKSSQVATSPCCQRDLPDVISSNPSSDAWSLATAVPRSAFTCFFLRVIGLPHEVMGRLPATVREYDFSRVAFSTLRHSLMFRPPRLLVPQVVPTAANVPQGSRDFYIRAERASLPRHAPDMLAVRIQVIDGARTSTLQDSQPCRLLPPHSQFIFNFDERFLRQQLRLPDRNDYAARPTLASIEPCLQLRGSSPPHGLQAFPSPAQDVFDPRGSSGCTLS